MDFVRDILDLSRRFDTVYACVQVCVCFLDSHVEAHITALFNLRYPHSKPIRFYIKSWNWELWGWEHRNREVAVLQSTSLFSWSLVQHCGFYCSFIYTLWLYLPQAAHTCAPPLSDACAALIFHQTSASLSGWTFVCDSHTVNVLNAISSSTWSGTCAFRDQ